MPNFRISNDALGDLEDIWHFIAQDNALAADGFINEFQNVFEKLTTAPRMGRSRDELGAGYRSHPHGNYVIFYCVRYEVVLILRVIHGGRDLRKALGEG